MSEEKHKCSEENAEKFWNWVCCRGGVAVWESVDLSCTGKSWSTPATIRLGDCEGHENDPDADKVIPYPKPTWQADNEPRVVTSAEDIVVYGKKEVKRFRVYTRVSGNGLSLKCTDASSRKISKAVAEIGKGAFYEFDYETAEAVIYQTQDIGTLAEYAKQKGWGA